MLNDDKRVWGGDVSMEGFEFYGGLGVGVVLFVELRSLGGVWIV